MDWDDLRFVTAVADHGSAVAAADRLGVNASTVQRRVSRFEQKNAVRLFERRQSGLRPTPECEALVREARTIEESVSSIRRDILARDTRLQGRLAVTTVDTLMHTAIAKHIAHFKSLHPTIELQVTLTNSRLDLSRQDADVAIRPSNNPPESLVGQKIASLPIAIYAANDLAQTIPDAHKVADLKKLPWIGLAGALRGAGVSSWGIDNIPQSSVEITVDSFAGVSTLVAAGGRLGLLPTNIGDKTKGISRVGKPIDELATSIWILTHPEIRTSAKIRAFMDFMVKAMRQDREGLEDKI